MNNTIRVAIGIHSLSKQDDADVVTITDTDSKQKIEMPAKVFHSMASLYLLANEHLGQLDESA